MWRNLIIQNYGHSWKVLTFSSEEWLELVLTVEDYKLQHVSPYK